MSLYYYARIVKMMFLDQPAAATTAPVHVPARSASASVGVLSARDDCSSIVQLRLAPARERSAGAAARIFRRAEARATAGGVLYVVATPIGNLEDVTLRALRVLREVDVVAAEDTRRTRVLLAHHGIARPRRELLRRGRAAKAPALVERLVAGRTVALVSDAGHAGRSPTRAIISCAGRSRRASAVVPMPGPSAVAALVSVAGLPSERFAFEGFLPSRAAARAARLRALAGEAARDGVPRGRPRGWRRSWRDARAASSATARPCIGRELTKMHEEIVRGPLSTLRDRVGGATVRGEVTVVIAGAAGDEVAAGTTAEAVDEAIASALTAGRSVREIADELSTRFGRPRRELYNRALEIRGR